jgi:hypothetical protein
MSIQEKQYEELAGDPVHLKTMANTYMGIADAIKRSVTALHAVRDNEEKADATKALAKEAGDVADDVEKAESRYRVTAQALLDYVPLLTSAQSDAHTAVLKIAHWEGQVTSTTTALDKANQDVDDADDADKDDAKSTQTTAETNATDAKKKLAYWQGQWTNAANARNTAAEAARNKIVDVVEHHNNGLKNPGFWGSVWNGIKSAGKWVWDHLDEISNWLGIASLLLGWVPILGDILIIATLAVGALKLIKDIAEGKGWKAILGDCVGLALSAFGGGATKLLAKSGKLAAGGKFLTAFQGSNKARNAAFLERYGVKTAQFRRFARTGAGTAKNLNKFAKPTLKNFLNEVKTPFTFAKGSVPTAFKDFIKSGGGLNVAKLGHNGVSFADGAAILKDMPTLSKLGLLAMDGRKVLGNVQTITNAANNFAHGDFALAGDRTTQVTLTPEKLALKVIPG